MLGQAGGEEDTSGEDDSLDDNADKGSKMKEEERAPYTPRGRLEGKIGTI